MELAERIKALNAVKTLHKLCDQTGKCEHCMLGELNESIGEYDCICHLRPPREWKAEIPVSEIIHPPGTHRLLHDIKSLGTRQSNRD